MKNPNKNRYPIRTDLDDTQINDLLIQYSINENKLQSLFSSKICSNIQLWKDDLARNGVSRNSIAKLNFEIFKINNDLPLCHHCKNTLSFSNYNGRIFSKYCKLCSKKYEFAKACNLSEETLSLRGEKITKQKLLFFQTEEGKNTAKNVGEKNSKALLGRKISDEQKKKQSDTMKKLIFDNKFSPGVSNNFTHWDSFYFEENIKYHFRSSWELCFYFCNSYLEYETVRIKYPINDTYKTYIADFYDRENNILYELKPKAFYKKQIQKMNAIQGYCIANNISFIWINEDTIMNFINIDKILNSNNDKIIDNFNKMINGIKYEITKS